MNTAFTVLSMNYSLVLPMRMLLVAMVTYSIDSRMIDSTLLSMITVKCLQFLIVLYTLLLVNLVLG